MDISFANLAYIEQQYVLYKQNPESVELSWRAFFEGWEMGGAMGVGGDRVKEAYRRYGHLKADVNPLHAPPDRVKELVGYSEEMEKTYCGVVGVEFEDLIHRPVTLWLGRR